MIRRNKLQLLKFDGKDNSLYFVMDSTNSIYFYGAEAKEGVVFRLNYAYVLDKLKKHNYFKEKQIVNIGDYIKKPMRECTGEEILEEVMYHLHMEDKIEEIKGYYFTYSYIDFCTGKHPGSTPYPCLQGRQCLLFP